MPRPEPGKTYLVVTCKSCRTGFRVVDTALQERGPQIDKPQLLTCRGCGHEAVYALSEMRPAYFTSKQN